MPRTPASSDHTITCRDYQRAPTGKRCIQYLEGGQCQHLEADGGRCVERLKLNAPTEVPEEPARDLFRAPIQPDPLRRRAAVSDPLTHPATPSQAEKPPLVGNVTDEEVASFKALGAEVFIRSAALGDVWRAPEYTGAHRVEVTLGEQDPHLRAPLGHGEEAPVPGASPTGADGPRPGSVGLHVPGDAQADPAELLGIVPVGGHH